MKTGAGHSRPAPFLLLLGQEDGECAALGRDAFDGSSAAVKLDDVLDDGQPQAGAARFATPRPVDAVEALEDPRQMLAADAAAVVANADLDLVLESQA